MSYRRMAQEIDNYQLALVCVGGFLVLSIFINILLFMGVMQAPQTAVKEFVKKQNESTLETCREDADDCHIEFIYDEDGNLLGGNVVGQSRK